MSTELKQGTTVKTSFQLIGVEELIVQSKEGISSFPLRECTPQIILKRRRLEIPTFILKRNDKLYITDINPELNLRFSADKSLNIHMCLDCARCRALPEELGGCSKVRDCSIETYLNNNPLRVAVELSKRIEKYDFIKYGYETFKCKSLNFTVLECSNYSPIIPRKKRPPQDVLKMKKSFFQQYYAYFHGRDTIPDNID